MDFKKLGWVGATLIVATMSGCKSTCLDDGFAWQQKEACTAASATQSASESESASATDTDASASATATTTAGTDTASASATMGTGSNSATQGTDTMSSASATDTMTSASATDTMTSVTASATDTMGTSTMTDPTGGPGLWCVDADMDGYGDPDQCTPVDPGDTPPPGTVNNGDDCDDGDPNTFPGAAPNDSPDECMKDADGDDWGDDDPPPGVVPGTDCDDDDAATFPGAAEVEDPTACMRDEDDDGWGDTSVPPGVAVGSDCYDNNADLNPADRILYSVLDQGVIGEVDAMSGMVTPYQTVTPPQGQWSVITAAVSPIDGLIYASNTAKTRIVNFDYCVGDVVELANHGRSICGLAFTPDGTLYAVDQNADELVIFDPMTGMVTDAKDLTVNGQPFNLNACGMAYDCVSGQLLVTDGQNSRILSIDPMTGDSTVVADVDEGSWNSVGLEYDPVSKQAYTCNGTQLYQIELDGSNNFTKPAVLSQSLNDLAYGPTCN